MLDLVYTFLARMGYSHPIHPAVTHIPTGLIFGAFILAWVSWLFRRPGLARCARQCAILAYVFIFPTILFGLMDWQHFYRGAWLFPIKMKIGLATLLLIVLLIGLIMGSKGKEGSKGVLVVYSLSFLIVVAIGYNGGNLVYSAGEQTYSRPSPVGEKLFTKNCMGCHPKGGNIIKPNLPLKKAPQLKEFSVFLSYIRNPVLPDGQRGPMPPFLPNQISDNQARELYGYILQVIAGKG